MGAKEFDYSKLPFEEIGRLYRDGWGWKAIASHYGAPDHKTLRKYAVKRLGAKLILRDHAQAQRARRAREGASSRKSGEKKQRRPWWLGGGES